MQQPEDAVNRAFQKEAEGIEPPLRVGAYPFEYGAGQVSHREFVLIEPFHNEQSFLLVREFGTRWPARSAKESSGRRSNQKGPAGGEAED